MSKRRRGYIYKRGETFWIKYMVEGRLFRQSLGTANRREAQAEADKILLPIQAGDAVATLATVKAKLETATTVAAQLADEADPPSPLP